MAEPKIFNETSVGGVADGGESFVSSIFNETSVGGVADGGESFVSSIFNETSVGGIFCSGSLSQDPYFSDVVLLLQESLNDKSLYNQTLNTSGNAGITTSDSKFGSSSLISGASTDYFIVQSDPSIGLGDGDFTVECFLNFDSFDSNKIYGIWTCVNNTNNSNRINFYLSTSGKLTVGIYGNILAQGNAINFANQTWHHFALSRTGSTLRLFVNGNQEASATSTINFQPDNFYLPRVVSGTSQILIDEFRVTVGTSRYKSNSYTVPNASFPYSSINVTAEYNTAETVGGVGLSGSQFNWYGWIPSGGLNTSGAGLTVFQDNKEVSGGAQISGTALQVFNDDIVALSNGLVSNGDFITQVEYNIQRATDGFSLLPIGTDASGQAENNVVNNLSVAGGLVLGGDADSSLSDVLDVFGGINAGGESTKQAEYNVVSFGGGSFGGDAILNVTNNIEVSGGVGLAGLSIIEVGIFASGGASVGGEGNEDFIDIIDLESAGLLASGEAEENFSDIIEITSAGTLSAGESLESLVQFESTSGGVGVSGLSLIELSLTAVGGANVSGAADEDFEDIIEVSGGALLNSKSITKQFKSPYVTEGLVETSGSAKSSVVDVKLNATGAISLSNTDSIVSNLFFVKTVNFDYVINSEIRPEITFKWNIGALEMYWYRVVGKGTTDPCFPTEPCCQRITLNVHARSLSELCEKLSKRRFKFPVETVERFTRPALVAVIRENEANGENYDCNNLVPVDICQIPACADFCVDQDVSTLVGFGISVAVDSFYEVLPEGEIEVSGISDVVFLPEIPRFYHVSEGGIGVQGNAELQKDFHVSRGGINIEGVSRLASSKWYYTGGEWPNSLLGRPQTIVSVSNNSNEKSWTLPERALDDNDIYTQSDITYGATSELLVVSGFNFSSLPSWARVTGVVVNVGRLSNTNNVRDEEVFLLDGSLRLSENLAVSNIDWPLLDTVRTYGPDGWFSENPPNELPPLYPLLSRQQIDSPGFGVGIRVRSNKTTADSTPTLAYVDYVEVQIEYEDPVGSIVRFSSDSGATAKSSGYSSFAIGRVILTANTDYRKTEEYDFVSSGGTEVAGDSNILYEEISFGGIETSGESLIRPFIEVASGGILDSGYATIKPYWDVMEGGVVVAPYSNRSGSWHYNASGNLNIEGQAFIPEVKWVYNPQAVFNLLNIGGSIGVKKSQYNFEAEGNVIFVYGNGGYTPGDILIDRQIFGYDVQVHDISVSRLNDIDVGDAEGVVDQLQQCGCFNLPSLLTLGQNFSNDNLFAKFLVRNNFTISKDLRLKYNTTNDSWQHNLHYKGYSVGGLDIESWNVVFELQCSNNIGGVVTGKTIWKLGIYLNRKVDKKFVDADTRIIVSILPDTLCLTTVSELDFVINYDVQTNLAYVNPDSTIYYNNIYDNIGLFRNPAWIENSNLQLSIKQVPLSEEYGIKDGTSTNLTKDVYVNN